LHRTFVAHVELGHKNLSFESLTTIATHLEVSLEKLVSGLEDLPLPVTTANPSGRSGRGEAALDPGLKRILTSLRAQKASLARTIAALEEFGTSPQLRVQKSTTIKR
jgi:hypothetical protein